MRWRGSVLSLCAAALLLSGCSADAVPAAGSDGVRADLEMLVRSGAVGAVTTRTDHGVTTVRAAGVADTVTAAAIPTDRPVHVRVASVTKTFTAALVLRLVAEGRVELDRSIDTYLPGVVPGGRDITVRQILGHHSGLPASPELDEYEAARTGRTYTPAELVGLALAGPIRFAPGARFEYTNTNYLVAGALVESVTGHSYADELRTRLLVPLSLTDTYLPSPGETGLREPSLSGYETVEGAVVDRTRIEPSLAWAAGGLISTGADLNRFFTALLRGDVVPEPLLDQMVDGVDMDLQGLRYGLGLIYSELPCGGRWVGHLGGGAGYTALSGASSPDRAVTLAYTGSVVPDDIPALMAHALCA